MIQFKGATDSLVMDGSYIGVANIEGKVNTGTGMVDFKAGSEEKDFSFNADGFYNYKDSTGNKIGIQFNSSRFRLNILQPYLKTVFSEVDGYAKGNMRLRDGQSAPLLL